MDEPEKRNIPPILQTAFDNNSDAFCFYKSLNPGYQKSHLRWLATAKTDAIIIKRGAEIISKCEEKKKNVVGNHFSSEILNRCNRPQKLISLGHIILH
jgi:uncharacterized protein YdeI (YjbR/CyaY-like superfamily)